MWIARLLAKGYSVRQIAAGVDRPPSTVAREMKRNGSKIPTCICRPAGPRPSLAGFPAGAGWSSAGEGLVPSGTGRLRSKWPDVSLWTKVGRSSPMRASTGLRWPGRRTTHGVTTCPGRPNGASGAGAAAAPPPTSPINQRPPRRRPATFGHWEGDPSAISALGSL